MSRNNYMPKNEELDEGLETSHEMRLYLERVHCADCVRDLIEGVVMRVEGVRGARFDEIDLCLVVEAGPRLDEGSLREAIVDVGYSFREPGEPTHRPSNFTNAILIAVAILLLAALTLWIQRI